VIPAASSKRWNARYVAYAIAHGRTCEAQLAHDRVRWPGGRMAGFLIWMSGALETWRRGRMAAGARIGRYDSLVPYEAEIDGWLYGYAFARAEEIAR
jgi:hypothetical protein